MYFSSQSIFDAMQVSCHIQKINKLSPHHQTIETIKTIHKSDDTIWERFYWFKHSKNWKGVLSGHPDQKKEREQEWRKKEGDGPVQLEVVNSALNPFR